MRLPARGPVGPSIRSTRLLATTLAVSALFAGCAASDGPVTTFAPASIGPDRTVSPAVGLTRGALVRALGERRLILDDAKVPFRPAEGRILTDAPRAVYQVVLPADPDRGFIVVYELSDPDQANQAARDQATYLATGPGQIQAPLNTVDIIRVVGSTVVLYSWIPDEARDQKAPDVQSALETLGIGVDVPS